jgi:hypothetical protein
VTATRISAADADFLAAAAARRGLTFPLRPQVGEVTMAILRGRSPRQVEKLARRVAAAIWERGLAVVAERALEELADDTGRARELVAAARGEQTRRPADNRFAEYLVLCEALRTARETLTVSAALDAAEVSLRDEPPEGRAEVALRHAGQIFALRGDVPVDELLDAAACVSEQLDAPLPRDLHDRAVRALAGVVATDERRRAVHRAAHDLRPAARRCRLFAPELERLAAVPAADDPRADELWVATVLGALELCRPA